MYYGHRVATDGIADLLNGAIVSTPFPARVGLPVGGRTIVFTTPAVTVTFSGAVGTYLSAQQIMAQINAAIPSSAKLRKKDDRGPDNSSGTADVYISLVLALDAGLVIDEGTALPFLKLGRLTQTLVDEADIIAFSPDATPGFHHIILKDH
jgi:hypothetical protein